MKTRKELEDVIRGGGSVIVDGRHVLRAEDLPGEAEAPAEAPDEAEAVTTRIEDEPPVVRKSGKK